jgi:hypothetical protein
MTLHTTHFLSYLFHFFVSNSLLGCEPGYQVPFLFSSLLSFYFSLQTFFLF